MSDTPLLLGGSRVYGFPREDSDWDAVVLTDPATAEILRGAFDRGGKSTRNTSIKVGDLNIILATSREEYDTWAKGIEELKARAPVEKAEAIRVFERLRAEKSLPEGSWDNTLKVRVDEDGEVRAYDARDNEVEMHELCTVCGYQDCRCSLAGRR